MKRGLSLLLETFWPLSLTICSLIGRLRCRADLAPFLALLYIFCIVFSNANGQSEDFVISEKRLTAALKWKSGNRHWSQWRLTWRFLERYWCMEIIFLEYALSSNLHFSNSFYGIRCRNNLYWMRHVLHKTFWLSSVHVIVTGWRSKYQWKDVVNFPYSWQKFLYLEILKAD